MRTILPAKQRAQAAMFAQNASVFMEARTLTSSRSAACYHDAPLALPARMFTVAQERKRRYAQHAQTLMPPLRQRAICWRHICRERRW
jgi:hypothetical protein